MLPSTRLSGKTTLLQAAGLTDLSDAFYPLGDAGDYVSAEEEDFDDENPFNLPLDIG